jgi:prophage regulatory protein
MAFSHSNIQSSTPQKQLPTVPHAPNSSGLSQHGSKILRLPTVLDRVGLKRSSVYQMMANGTFPKPIKLGARAVGWPSNSVDTWIAQRTEQSCQVNQAGVQ